MGTDTEYLATGVHSRIKSPPSVVTLVQKVDHVVEKVVEKPVEVEKVVEVERVIEKVVEVPRVKKVIRVRYVRNPLEFAAIGLLGLVLGLIIGLLL